MKMVYVVLIHNLKTKGMDVARVFTKEADANIFVDECERVEPTGFEYFIEPTPLDADPLDNY